MEHRGLWVRGFCVCLLALALVGSVNAKAEEAPDDAAGRAYFERGRQAFESADYESALTYFRHAYRLSRRGELQYNIGVTADRLQREEEALEAFQRYLKESEDPTRAAEARERIEVLERSIAERKATELALREATIRYQSAQTGPSDGKRLPTSAIAGGSALAAVGVAGVAAMSVGLAQNGSCQQQAGGTCVVERSATAWSWVYGGLGVAALAGSATWFGVSAKRAKRARETSVSVTPTGLLVSGKF